MTDPMPEPISPESALPESTSPESASPPQKPPPTVFECWSGSAIAALLAGLSYLLTANVIGNFAARPFTSTNYLTVNIASAVRTLVTGLFSMATGICAIAALGLFALGIQTLIQGRRSPQS